MRLRNTLTIPTVNPYLEWTRWLGGVRVNVKLHRYMKTCSTLITINEFCQTNPQCGSETPPRFQRYHSCLTSTWWLGGVRVNVKLHRYVKTCSTLGVIDEFCQTNPQCDSEIPSRFQRYNSYLEWTRWLGGDSVNVKLHHYMKTCSTLRIVNEFWQTNPNATPKHPHDSNGTTLTLNGLDGLEEFVSTWSYVVIWKHVPHSA